MVGWLIFSLQAMQFLIRRIWGGLSDRFGSKTRFAFIPIRIGKFDYVFQCAGPNTYFGFFVARMIVKKGLEA